MLRFLRVKLKIHKKVMLISSGRVLQSKHALWFTFADLCKQFEVAY